MSLRRVALPEMTSPLNTTLDFGRDWQKGLELAGKQAALKAKIAAFLVYRHLDRTAAPLQRI